MQSRYMCRVFEEPDLKFSCSSEGPVFFRLLLAEGQNENTPQLIITIVISDAKAHTRVV